MSHYIFVLNTIEFGDVRIDGNNIAENLLKNELFRFSNSTHNKKIKNGDKVLLYIAGKGNRMFYGTFTIAGDIKENVVKEQVELDKPFYDLFPFSREISDIKIFEKPIYMVEVKDKLPFIKDKKNWGLFIRHAITPISKEDYDYILTHYKE